MNSILTRARIAGAGRAAVEVAINIALPFAIYSIGRRALGDVGAMMAASGPPLAWSILEFALRRRIDALSLIVLAGIGLSLLAFFGGGGVRLLQLREQLPIAVIGLVFLGSAAVGRPLIYQLARARLRRRSQSEAEGLEALRDHPLFRRAMTVMTLAWGVSLLAEAALAAVLVFTLSIRQFLIVSPVIGYCWLAALTAWTYWYARRRIGPLRLAAQSGGA